MKKLFSLASLLLVSLMVFSAVETKKVAILEVVDKEGKLNYSQKLVLRSSLAKAITNTQGYEAYDRTDIDAIMSEHEFQNTGLVSKDQIQKLGEMAGVSLILVAEGVLTDDNQMFVAVKLLDVESAKVVMTDNLIMGLSSGEMQAGSEQIASSLFEKKKKNNKKPDPSTQVVTKVVYQQPQQNSPQNEHARIENSLSCGYVQMDNLLVTIPDFAWTTYKNANESAKKCRLGGYSDWRLPNRSELMSIFQTSKKYHDICPDFPDFRDEKIFKHTRYYNFYRYWCGDKYFYEVKYEQGRYKVEYGHGTVDDVMARECYSFFVRNK